MIKIFKNIVILSLCISFNANLSFAGIGEDMSNFLDSINSTSNVNGAARFQGQSSGYYTLGSASIRNRVVSINPVNIQLPSITAGCGGIDIFTGAFSHINLDQFVLAAKAIASNSLGYAFKLALKTLSPAIENTMADLQEIVDEINNFNINSCEAAQNLVGGLWPVTENNKQYLCETTGNAQGVFSDFAQSKSGCQSDSAASSTASKNSNASNLINVNITWKALKDGGYVNYFGTDTAEVFMNMIGTIIINSDNSSYIQIPAKIRESDFSKVLMNGGSITIYGCSETDKCLTTSPKTVNISEDNAFQHRVEETIISLKTKLELNKSGYSESLTESEKSFIELVNFPVYKILQITVANKSSGALFNTTTLSQLAANDILQKYFEEILEMTQKSLYQLKSKGTNTEAMEDMLKSVNEFRRWVESRSIEHTQKMEFALKLISVSQEFERQLSSEFASDIGGVLTYSNQLNNE
jgi:conjugative transfer pilus assembly protein TraH